MKSSKNHESEINISVIGLSGSQRLKGLKGVGKSCLCNRLAQPNHYKSKHKFLLSTNDFCGLEMTDSQWLFWGCVERYISDKLCRFRIIEQTTMVESVPQYMPDSAERSVQWATATELHGTKHAQIINPEQYYCSPLIGQTSVHLFMLVYDVSNVRGRDPAVQDSIFSLLFDRAIALSRPVIVVSSKHDKCSPPIKARLTALLNQERYRYYPLVETSARLGVNTDVLFELASVMRDCGRLTDKERVVSFQDSRTVHRQRQDRCGDECRAEMWSVIDNERWYASWAEVRLLPLVDAWVHRLGSEEVAAIFEEVRITVREERRSRGHRRYKEILTALLDSSMYLQTTTSYDDVSSLIRCLTNDPIFMSHFIDFDHDAEYFDITKNVDLLPLHILDESNRNNMIFVIKEYLGQQRFEEQLFQRLITDCPGNFRKSEKDIGDYLSRYIKYYIQENIIVKVNKRFQRHYLKILEHQFLETSHENLDLFLSQKIIDRCSTKPWTINDLPINMSSSPLSHDNHMSDLDAVIKDINSKLQFQQLSIAEDEHNVRGAWILNFLNFLLSNNESDCIAQHVTMCLCNSTIIGDAISRTDLDLETNTDHLSHVYYVIIVGNNNSMKGQLTDFIVSQNKISSSEQCKLRNTEYKVQLVDNIASLKDIVHGSLNGDKQLCGVCVLICDCEVATLTADMDQLFLQEQIVDNYQLQMYFVHGVMDDLVKVTAIDRGGPLKLTPDNGNIVPISTLLSSCRQSVEPSLIWVVSVCGDLYNYHSLIRIIISVLKLHSSPRRLNSAISGYFTCKDVNRRRYRLCFMPYHHAMKMLIRRQLPPSISGILLLGSLDRLASLNTCLGIRKKLPPELMLSCHCMLLGISGRLDTWSEYARIEAYKQMMKYASVTLEKNFGHRVENQISEFFIDCLNGSQISMTTEDISTMTTLLTSRSEIKPGIQASTSDHNLCKKCEQCRSHENVHNKSGLTESNTDVLCEPISYDQVLGDTNADIFDNYCPEFIFHWAQDVCNKCTEVKCNIYQHNDSEICATQPFRTRIRSKSGPDLRSYFHSNKSALNKSDTSRICCSSCGDTISLTNGRYDSKKSLVTKPPGDKESPSKRFSAIFQDFFGPIRRLNETQSHDSRKLFIRTTSKRRK